MANLEEAIQVTRKAVEMAPSDHLQQAMFLNNLGLALGDRYERTGAMADLEQAIQVAQEAVKATPSDDPDRATRLNNLGLLLGDRCERTGAMNDHEQAIQVAQEAVEAAQSDHPDQPLFLNNLGNRLGDKYSITGTMNDLTEAIRLIQRAVGMTPLDNPERAMFLNNLGISLGEKYKRTSEIADLKEAIYIAQEAVKATPSNHPDRAARAYNLGLLLRDSYSSTGAESNLKAATLYHREALEQSNSSTITRIEAGRQILRCCAITSDWQQAYEAADTTVRLIPTLTPQSLQNSDKQHMLGQVVGLASDAAAVALNAGKDPLSALNLLELGRGVLGTSLEEMRTDVLDLRRRYPTLAERFVNIRDELDFPVARTVSSDETRNLPWQTQVNRRYDANQKLEKLITEIRSQPGFEDFLLPREEELQVAARRGPIVVVNVSQHGCNAFLVEQHQIRSLALPRLSHEDVVEKAQETSLGRRTTLEWLWHVAMHPILDALRFTQPPFDDDWPCVWWIPTGPLSKFPLHAAGRHAVGSVETVLDRIMSSYSSSIKAIIHGRRRRIPAATTSTRDQALLVAMQDTPEQSRLHFATEEIEVIHDLCQSMAIKPVELGRRKQDILFHLPACKIFHFAGHGHTDHFDPSQSYLLLEDWKSDRLTVATILETNLREQSPFLAYLSSCGTGQVKEDRFIDESIHLIIAFQLAGFRHVIGTLWEVNDESCVDMSRITYEAMRQGGLTDDSVCQGLHRAARELRDSWVHSLATARSGGKSGRKSGLEETADGIEALGIDDQDKSKARLPRDVTLCDDDDDKPLHWVPYVHFGV